MRKGSVRVLGGHYPGSHLMATPASLEMLAASAIAELAKCPVQSLHSVIFKCHSS